MFGRIGFKQCWNLCFCPPPFAEKLIQTWIGQCEVAPNLDLNNAARSSNLTAPSSSPWIDSSCRSNLIIVFDTSKQLWQNVPRSISIHFRSRSSPTLATRISSDVSVRCLLVPFTIRTQEVVSHEIKIRSRLPRRNVFDENRPSHPRLARSSCFHRSTLSGMIHHFEAKYTLDMTPSICQKYHHQM